MLLPVQKEAEFMEHSQSLFLFFALLFTVLYLKSQIIKQRETQRNVQIRAPLYSSSLFCFRKYEAEKVILKEKKIARFWKFEKLKILKMKKWEDDENEHGIVDDWIAMRRDSRIEHDFTWNLLSLAFYEEQW